MRGTSPTVETVMPRALMPRPSGWGRVSRARVGEIFVGVEWVEGQRPRSGSVEFTVRTSGVYDDTRLVGGQSRLFHFQGAPVDLSFRYDLAATPHDTPACIRVRAAIAELNLQFTEIRSPVSGSTWNSKAFGFAFT